MKKLFALGLFALLCGNASAQTNAASAPNQAASSNPPTAQAPAAPQNDSTISGVTGGHNAAYTDRIPPEQLLTLDANGDKFQARHIADLSGQPLGAAIILHDSGQHPTWPFTAAALIDDLPLHGWDTLAIELSAPDTEAAAGVEPKMQARINAAIKYFADQNQRNIALIGFGSGAIRAAENLRAIAAGNPAAPGVNSQPKTAPLTALVMIAPQQKLISIEMDLPKLLPLTEIATLDMLLDNEPLTRAEAEARRRAVLHQRTRIYTRLELPPLNDTSDAQHSTMVKRARSWLQKNAQAVR